MNKNEINQKIIDLKNKIADSKDYINSDFCENCMFHYKQIDEYKKELEIFQKLLDEQ